MTSKVSAFEREQVKSFFLNKSEKEIERERERKMKHLIQLDKRKIRKRLIKIMREVSQGRDR